ncbi:MAG: hypothetical protein HY650_09520 [Acidobacteria bacterium]|nr:hypothetical protein [Acidobacteriota bacterium]
MEADIIHRFHTALPQVRDWIDQLVDAHADRARVVSTLGFSRLLDCFPREVLDRAKVVSINRVPFPPVKKIGLPELAAMEERSLDGITFRDTFFLQEGLASEGVYFHELVHVVQWTRLGLENFLLAYGLGLVSFEYAQSPLERMAYELQKNFERDTLPRDLVRVIEEGTDDIWNQAAPTVLGSKVPPNPQR